MVWQDYVNSPRTRTLNDLTHVQVSITRKTLFGVKFETGTANGTFDTTVQMLSKGNLNIRHNALESARLTSNKLLEKNLGKAYHLRIKTYPHHVLRENALASGAGADRLSTGMKKSFGKIVGGAAARVKEGQAIMEVRVDKANVKLAKQALERASKNALFM